MKKSYQKHSAFPPSRLGKAPLRRDDGCILHSAFPPAFTLIELLVVMVVITIMIGITIPISKYVTHRAREANQRIYIEKIKSALEDYRAAYGEYPITPTNDGAARHYPANYATKCYYTTNSPSTNVTFLATGTVEPIITGQSTTNSVDYCLTYPLMLRQLAEGARPFMDFKEVTVVFLVYQKDVQKDLSYTVMRKKKSGGLFPVVLDYILGNPVNRPKAIDPVSMKQWKYTSLDGITYTLTTNLF